MAAGGNQQVTEGPGLRLGRWGWGYSAYRWVLDRSLDRRQAGWDGGGWPSPDHRRAEDRRDEAGRGMRDGPSSLALP